MGRIRTKYGKIPFTFFPYSDYDAKTQIAEERDAHEKLLFEHSAREQTLHRVAQSMNALIAADKEWFEVSDYLDWLRKAHMSETAPAIRCGRLHWAALSCPAGASG